MILYYLTEALKMFKRVKMGTFLIVITTTIAVLLTSFSILLIILSNTISEKLKSRIEINLFVDDSLSNGKIDSLQTILKNDANISSVKFITKEQAAENFVKETGEDFRNILDVNPLPAAFSIRFKPKFITEENISSIADSYKNIEGIVDVVYDYSTTLKILSMINSARAFIYTASVLLILLSIYLVYSNNKSQIASRQRQFATMKLVGAKLRAIKIPMYIFSFILGLIASGICIAIYNLCLIVIANTYRSVSYTELVYLFNFVILALGIIFGLLGSYLSLRKVTLNIEKF